METQIHPETGCVLQRDTRPFTVRIKGVCRTEEVTVPGWYPDDDGDAIFEGDGLAIISEAQRRLDPNPRRGRRAEGPHHPDPHHRLAEYILEAMWSTHKPDPHFDTRPHIDSRHGLRDVVAEGLFDMIAIAEVVWEKLRADDLSATWEERLKALERRVATIEQAVTSDTSEAEGAVERNG